MIHFQVIVPPVNAPAPGRKPPGKALQPGPDPLQQAHAAIPDAGKELAHRAGTVFDALHKRRQHLLNCLINGLHRSHGRFTLFGQSGYHHLHQVRCREDLPDVLVQLRFFQAVNDFFNQFLALFIQDLQTIFDFFIEFTYGQFYLLSCLKEPLCHCVDCCNCGHTFQNNSD